MIELKKIQRAFQESLENHNDAVTDYISKPEDMNAKDRLQVYYNDYFFRLRDALQEDYEKTCRLIGKSKFEFLAKAYMKAYPSTSYTLREIGYEFPKFLETQKQDPALVELATFECGMIYALYATDAMQLTLESLAVIDPDAWPDLCFHFHPSVQKLTAEYNTVEMWSALDNNQIIKSRRLDQPSISIIWRHNQGAFFRQIDEKEAVLFSTIQSGATFSGLCEMMMNAAEEEEIVSWIAGILQIWVSEGLFSGFDHEL